MPATSNSCIPPLPSFPAHPPPLPRQHKNRLQRTSTSSNQTKLQNKIKMKITPSTTAVLLSFLAASAQQHQSLRGRALAVAEEDKQSANGLINSGGQAGGNGGGNGNWKGKNEERCVCVSLLCRLDFRTNLAFPPSLLPFPPLAEVVEDKQSLDGEINSGGRAGGNGGGNGNWKSKKWEKMKRVCGGVFCPSSFSTYVLTSPSLLPSLPSLIAEVVEDKQSLNGEINSGGRAGGDGGGNWNGKGERRGRREKGREGRACV